MSKDKNIPEPEALTSQIEKTIDDLFKPTKKIEIDPRTQEVREIDDDQTKSQDDLLKIEVAEEVMEEHGQGEKKKEDDILEEKESIESEEIELELELEMEEEATEEKETAQPSSIAKEDTVHAIPEKLTELREHLYTLEWETSVPEINKTLEIFREISNLNQITEDKDMQSLVETCISILEFGEDAPQNLPSNVPVLLKETADELISCLKEEGRDKGMILDLKERFQQIIFKMKGEKPKTAPMDVSSPITSIDTELGLSQEARELLKEHIIVLKKDVNKILPFENILSNTPGMEKLLKFQQGIRASLEHEIDRLCNFFFKDEKIELPKPSLKVIHHLDDNIHKEEPPVTTEELSCPFKEISIFSVDGKELGVPTDEVAYLAPPPWLFKGFLKTADSIPLTKLKPWPWSRLKGLFSNKLQEVDVEELKEMDFQVVDEIDDLQIVVENDFYILLLFDGENGVALRLSEPLLETTLPEDSKFIPLEKPFVGKVLSNESEIFIVTAKSLS